jgi:hypothetical protein
VFNPGWGTWEGKVCQWIPLKTAEQILVPMNPDGCREEEKN